MKLVPSIDHEKAILEFQFYSVSILCLNASVKKMKLLWGHVSKMYKNIRYIQNCFT